MRRRELIALLGGAAGAWPLAPRAQQKAMPVIGLLLSQPNDPQLAGIIRELRGLGYADGHNARLLIRSAETKLEQLPHLAAELVTLKPDVIVAINTPPTRAAVEATKVIPIVMMAGDPIGSGFVDNLSHPGGNVTGISNFAGELTAKKQQLLKELLPTATRVATLLNSSDPVTAPQVREAERAAPLVGLDLRLFSVRSQSELEIAFRELQSWQADALQWLSGQERIFVDPTIVFAAQRRLPLMVPRREQVDHGGLICYYPVQADLQRRIAEYVDKIIKGAPPGDLPVQQPTKFELVINLKTAKALGLTVPQTLLARADEVIE